MPMKSSLPKMAGSTGWNGRPMAWACTPTSRGPMDGNAQPSPFCPECRSNGCCEWAELQRVVGPASPCRPYDDGIDDTRRVTAAAHVYPGGRLTRGHDIRSAEHTSELQSLMRISYAVF